MTLIYSTKLKLLKKYMRISKRKKFSKSTLFFLLWLRLTPLMVWFACNLNFRALWGVNDMSVKLWTVTVHTTSLCVEVKSYSSVSKEGEEEDVRAWDSLSVGAYKAHCRSNSLAVRPRHSRYCESHFSCELTTWVTYLLLFPEPKRRRKEWNLDRRKPLIINAPRG